MPLFRRNRSTKSRPQHELCDIPLGSMIELSDEITFVESGNRTFEVIERKKYEAPNLLRFMYRMVDDGEEIVLGVDQIPDSDEFEVVRFIIDSEEESGELLADVITLHYDNPDDPDEMIDVDFERQEIVQAQMSLFHAEGLDRFDVELHEYANADGTLMSVEQCGDWLTFYVGEMISEDDVNVYPGEDEGEYLELPPDR